MVRREIAPTSQALQVAYSRLFREPMLSESTSFGSRWGIYEMGSSQHGRQVRCVFPHRTRRNLISGRYLHERKAHHGMELELVPIPVSDVDRAEAFARG